MPYSSTTQSLAPQLSTFKLSVGYPYIIMTIPLLVAKIFSAFYFLEGLSLLFAPQQWNAFMEAFIKQKYGGLGMALFALPFALLIVFSHPIWIWHPIVLITIFGWLMLFKFIAFLLFPHWGFKLMPKTPEGRIKYFKWASLFPIIIGATLLYYTFLDIPTV